VQEFGRWLAQAGGAAHPAVAARDCSRWRSGPRPIRPATCDLMIGPEGGFSAEEEETALAQGALALSMGPRVLRTETAGLAALATLNAVWSAE
jgi:16S rRNA (uracil1498-N3)-methyltransferase